MTRANAASSNLQESSGRCDYQPGGLSRCGLYALDDVPVVESVHVVEDTVGRPEDPPNPHSLGEVLFVHDLSVLILDLQVVIPNVVPVDSILAGLFPKS